MTIFIRLLASPVPAKGDNLSARISALNANHLADGVYNAYPADLTAIPGAPFAYWISQRIRRLFSELPAFENESRTVKQGLATADDFRFVRTWWEISPNEIVRGNPESTSDEFRQQTYSVKKWVWFAKGGRYLPFYSNIHLVVLWEKNGEAIRRFERAVIRNEERYFNSGLTYIARTNKTFCPRILPKGCVYGHVGPAIFIDEHQKVLACLAIFSSSIVEALLLVSMSRGVENSSQTKAYEVGNVSILPFPPVDQSDEQTLTEFSLSAYEIARQTSLGDEIAHVFYLPSLLNFPDLGLAQRVEAVVQVENQYQSDLDAIQAKIDAHVAKLYGVTGEILLVGGEQFESGESTDAIAENDDDESEIASFSTNPYYLISDLIMWCVGVAMGRWDVRIALNPSKPPLPGPFDPLPVCSPGMLTSSDGSPLKSPPDSYPLPVAWDGFLVDDPDHQSDIVLAVRNVLNLILKDHAEDIEAEACRILQVPDLRAWFRDPKGFFAYHIKRYSKSRRKAPIYWLLQSAKRNYGIWLYYPRLNPDSLFRAGREYADAKLSLEMGRLKDLQTGLSTAIGSARKVQERKMAIQEALAAELKSFQKTLDAAAMMELKPDLNDGVLLNIAPLYELVPWKEAERTWQELLRGKYEWSSISKSLRQKGLVKS